MVAVNKAKLKPVSVSFTSMGSPCEVKIMTRDPQQQAYVLQLAVNEVKRLNDKYSRYNPASLLSRINQAAGTGERILLDEETNAIMNYADVCYRESDGLFDITSGVLRQAWNFKNLNGPFELPAQSLIEELLTRVGWQQVYWQDSQFALPKPGMEIDFGGIVKEYAADAVAALCLKEGIKSGLVNLGGDIKIIGSAQDNDTWSVFIQNPDKSKKQHAELSIRSGAVATSGVYERFIEHKGKRYSHLLNPKTGWPIEHCAASLTVLAEHCIIAGSVSTIGLLQGRECATWMQDNTDLPFWCCLDNGQLITRSCQDLTLIKP